MKKIKIINHRVDFLKSLIDINIIKVGSIFTEIEFCQKTENLCLLHDIGLY